MPTPKPASDFAQALRDEGLRVITTPGWATHNRNHKGPWGPVNGVMIHHTVTGPNTNGVLLCRDGYRALPGPLCHGVIRRNGEVHLIGYGRTNHAGGGDPAVLNAVIAEDYNNRPPTPRKHEGSDGAVDGNAHFYGFECENLGDGIDPWPDEQVDAIIRAAAAVCRLYGWTAKSVIGHSEWSDWKSDPRGPGISMPDLRRRIANRLHPTPTPKPAPVETPMPELRPIDVWNYRNAKADQASIEAGNGRIPDAYGYLVETHRMLRTLVEHVAALTDMVTALQRETDR